MLDTDNDGTFFNSHSLCPSVPLRRLLVPLCSRSSLSLYLEEKKNTHVPLFEPSRWIK